MKMRENEQSFVFGVSVSDYNFIGRKEEIRRLKMNFLRCILSGHHDDFGETAVREEFQLGSVSNITRLKTALVDKDIVEMSGKRYYIPQFGIVQATNPSRLLYFP